METLVIVSGEGGRVHFLCWLEHVLLTVVNVTMTTTTGRTYIQRIVHRAACSVQSIPFVLEGIEFTQFVYKQHVRIYYRPTVRNIEYFSCMVMAKEIYGLIGH